MTMDLPTLQKTISGALKGTTFSLDTTALGSPVQTLVAALLQQSTLALSGASVDASGSQPSAQGNLTSAPQSAYGFLAGFQVVATFSLDANNTPQLHLTLTPPPDRTANWGLLDALPDYKNSFFAAFAWANARFDFDTQAAQALPANFPAEYGLPPNSSSVLGALQKGMSFQADLTYKGQDAGLLWLLGGKTAHIAGPIEWDGALPRMDLATGTLTTLSLEGFSLPIALHLVAVLAEIPAAGDNPATVRSTPLGVLQGELDRPINKTQSLTIPFFVELYQDPARQVTVEGNFQEASSLALQEVASLLGISSLDNQQASGFPTLSGLSLKTVSLTVDTGRQQLITASANVGFTPPGGPWKPFGDLLSFDGLAITFTVLGPLSSPTFETSIDCQVGLAGGTLDAWINLPNLDFGCELQNGTTNPIDLTQILDSITGGAFTQITPKFRLLCTQLRVLGNTSQNLYRFQATVQDDWSFDFLGANFALSSIGFDITHQAGPNSGTTGQVVAQLIVADVAVQISADYQGEQQGWTFSGGTLGTQNISLTDLVGDALKLFGLNLPAHAPQVSITDLQMMLQTGSMDFGFSCEGQVTMLGTTVDIGIDLGRTHDDPQNPKAVTTVFSGYLSIGPSTFEVDFTAAPTGDSLLFKWTDTDQPLTFEHIAGWFGYTDMPPLPENLDLSLTAAVFYYDFGKDTLVFSATSKNYGQILFASFVPAPPSPNTKRIYLFELDVPLNLEMSDLPVIGDKLPAQLALGIKDLQVIISTAGLAANSDMKTLNDLVAAVGDKPLLPTALNAGLTFAAALQMGSARQPIVLPLTGGASASAPAPASPSAPSAPSYQGSATWFNIEKSFGPVQFQRIGVQYQDSVLFFLLDMSLSFSALNLALDGLGIGSPLTHVSLVPHLDGLSVSFSSGPVTINGGLLVVPSSVLPKDVAYEYMGEVTIAVDPYLINGTAAYAKVDGQSSFFLFAQVTGEFGGPPAFFITGFMGGFGYNSQLTLPDPNQVYTFPFIAGLDDTSIFGPNPTPLSVLNVLSGAGGKPAWVTPATGAYWIAAGLLFRSFELVLGRMMLVATFGKDLEIALLGLASMSLPQGAPPAETYAFVELQLEAVLKPDDGFFGVFASLTPNSYLLTKDCHLTGGFAFCLWFGDNPHAGDFVVTVGGYHPAFVPPAWYPKVAIVGFNWPISGDLTVKGGAYFALTPTAVMAGGNLEVLFHAGNLRAWFIAYANLLIRWKPFQFLASIGVSLGASYRLNLLFTTVTITIELGATVDMGGPPTGGVVHIHWYIISFSISFGGGLPDFGATKLTWPDLQSLLPADPSNPSTPAVLDVQINQGLSRKDSASGAWIVRGDELVFTTHTAVPASQINLNGSNTSPALAAAADAPPAGINIRPMELSNVQSVHSITVTNLDDNAPVVLTTWAPAAQTRNLPEALWGTPLNGALPPPSAATVSAQTGVQLTAPPAQVGPSPGPATLAALDVEPLPGGPIPLIPASQTDPLPPPAPDASIIQTIGTTLASSQAQQAQQALVAALTTFQAAPPTQELLTQLAAQAGVAFSPPGPLRASAT